MIHKFSRDILGLDIRSDAVSAVLIKSGMKGLTIEASKHIRFSDAEEPAGTGLCQALASIASEMDITGAFCIAALPFSRLSIRTLSVPFMDAKKIRQILPYELEPALPLPVENQVVDFLSLDQETQGQTTELLIASVEQDELKFYLDQLASAGLDPEVVTINGHASASALAERATGEGFMFADIGRKKVLVYVTASGKIEFVRSFPVPLETGKRVSSITTGLVHTFLTCEERFPGQPLPGKIILSGRGDDEPEIRRSLEEKLSLPVQSMDFIKETELNLLESPDSSWVPGEMDNALALCYCESRGLKGFNFRKGPFAQKKLWMDHKTDFIQSGILAGLVLFLLILSSFAETLILKNRLTSLNHEITGVFKATFPGRTVTVAPLEQMKSELQSKKSPSLFSEDMKTDIRTIDMLYEISMLIPNDLDVKMTKLVYGPGSVLITGSTKTFNTVDDMKNRLEKSSLFKGVTIASANLNRAGDRVDFKLKIDLV
jgi:Tfp pilus assembly protein PilN